MAAWPRASGINIVCGRYSDSTDLTVAGTAPGSHRIPLYGCKATHRKLRRKDNKNGVQIRRICTPMPYFSSAGCKKGARTFSSPDRGKPADRFTGRRRQETESPPESFSPAGSFQLSGGDCHFSRSRKTTDPGGIRAGRRAGSRAPGRGIRAWRIGWPWPCRS